MVTIRTAVILVAITGLFILSCQDSTPPSKVGTFNDSACEAQLIMIMARGSDLFGVRFLRWQKLDMAVLEDVGGHGLIGPFALERVGRGRLWERELSAVQCGLTVPFAINRDNVKALRRARDQATPMHLFPGVSLVLVRVRKQDGWHTVVDRSEVLCWDSYCTAMNLREIDRAGPFSGEIRDWYQVAKWVYSAVQEGQSVTVPALLERQKRMARIAGNNDSTGIIQSQIREMSAQQREGALRMIEVYRKMVQECGAFVSEEERVALRKGYRDAESTIRDGSR